MFALLVAVFPNYRNLYRASILPEYESWQVINEADFVATGYEAELHVHRYPELVPIEQTRECFASPGNKFPRNQIKS